MQSQYPVVEAVLMGTRAIFRFPSNSDTNSRGKNSQDDQTPQQCLKRLEILEVREAERPNRAGTAFFPGGIGQRKKSLGNLGIELRSAASRNFGLGLFQRKRTSVRTVRSHRVQSVRHRENAGAQRNIFTLESIWIAGAV